MQRDAWRAEQARGGLGDLLQRLFGIARGARDGTQDFGAAVLALVGGAELVLKPGDPAPEIGHHVLGKRGHWSNPPRAVPGGTELTRKTRPSGPPDGPIPDYSILDASELAPTSRFLAAGGAKCP
jgi:hypothetical protein